MQTMELKSRVITKPKSSHKNFDSDPRVICQNSLIWISRYRCDGSFVPVSQLFKFWFKDVGSS